MSPSLRRGSDVRQATEPVARGGRLIRMTRLHHALLLLAAAGMLLAGCGDDGSGGSDGGAVVTPADADLAGRTFVSTDVTVGGAAPWMDASVLRLSFEDGSIHANAGCNQIGGSVSIEDDTLTVDGGSLAMTEMGCDPELMDQDTWVAELLTSSPTIALAGDTLTLTSGDIVITLVDLDTIEPDLPLTGTLWQLESIGSGGADSAVSSLPSGVTSTLAISADAEAALSPGCNTGGATVDIAADTLTFGPVRMTKMMCEGPANKVEQTVLRVLDGQVDYTIERSSLTVTKGDTSLTYVAAPAG